MTLASRHARAIEDRRQEGMMIEGVSIGWACSTCFVFGAIVGFAVGFFAGDGRRRK